jgi:hypothetical protein
VELYVREEEECATRLMMEPMSSILYVKRVGSNFLLHSERSISFVTVAGQFPMLKKSMIRFLSICNA